MPARSQVLLLATFRDVYQDLVRFLTHRIGSRQDALELVHETWLRLAERRPVAASPAVAAAPAEPDPSMLRAYVYTVAENLAIDHLRRGQRTAARFAPESAVPFEGESGTHDAADAYAYRQAIAAIDDSLT